MLGTVVECLAAEEEGAEDIDIPSDERRGESEGEGQAPMKSSVMDQWQNKKVIRSKILNELIKLHTDFMVRLLKLGIGNRTGTTNAL